ncbi:MAG: RDD family protein [Thermoanaerobaculia bacterium]|nr:RDD family protein [Thermoanaerobaculia bacterium]MBP9823106.1 RDD family protein [Thermoanaerobaculia bacterium]
MSQADQVSQTGWQIFVEVPGKAPIELPPGESVIGRSRNCVVQIAETTVSRQHAIFVVAPGNVLLRDLGSSNGTFVNGERVDGEIPLADGDRVVVGEAELVLRMLAPLGPAEATARLVIPPMTRADVPPPGASPAPPFPPMPPSLPAAATPGSSAAPAWASTPLPAPGVPTVAPIAASAAGASGAAPGSAHSRPAPGSQAPWAPTPLSRIPPAPAPLSPAAGQPPPRTSQPPASPADPAKNSGELLSSIRDIDLAPIPAPAPRHSSVASPASPASPMAKVATTGKVEPAGFWLRVAAYVLDYIPVAFLGIAYWIVAIFVSPNLATMLGFVLPIYGLLVVFFLPALKGTTPGKKILKLAIVSETTGPGEGLGWKIAALRVVGHFVCGLTFGLGYLLVAFSARKQGLHDLIAKTNVVRQR